MHLYLFAKPLAEITFSNYFFLGAVGEHLHLVYRHQSDMSVYFVSTASIIFIIWTTKVFKLVDCQTVSLFSVID